MAQDGVNAPADAEGTLFQVAQTKDENDPTSPLLDAVSMEVVN